MCGRYALEAAIDEVHDYFDVDLNAPFDWPARYNIAPMTEAPIVRRGEGGRELALARWGLVPHWAKDQAIAPKLINARSETAHSKPAFRDALASRRCLVPASGFYEWQRRGGVKQPFYFASAEGHPLGFAGLWELWRGTSGQTLHTCTILTTSANEAVRRIHDRMPVILPPPAFGAWLDVERTSVEQARQLLRPYPADQMRWYEVDRRVNSTQHDDPSLIEPRDADEGLLDFGTG